MRLTREFYRPSPSSNAVKEVIDDIPGSEVYRYEGGKNGNTYPVAMVFGGKRAKPDFHFRFQRVEQQEKRISEWAEGQKYRAAETKRRRAERNAPHNFKVGQKFYISWGYDQTNIDFYRLEELKGKCMGRIVPIYGKTVSSNPPQEMVVAGDQIREWDVLLGVGKEGAEKGVWKKLSTNGFSCKGHYSASPDNGQEHYETSAGWGH